MTGYECKNVRDDAEALLTLAEKRNMIYVNESAFWDKILFITCYADSKRKEVVFVFSCRELRIYVEKRNGKEHLGVVWY